MSLFIYALLARQVLSADSLAKDELTREQFGRLQINLHLGGFLDNLPMPTLPTSVPNLLVSRMMENVAKDSLSANLEGYFVTGLYDDDTCSTLLNAFTSPLNKCVEIAPGLYQFITATSNKVTINAFSDSECSDSSISMSWPPDCMKGMKFFYSQTKENLINGPHLVVR